LPSPQFEWMLTDTCGNTNQGVQTDPKMNLYSATYQVAQSVYSGNAVSFAGNSGSYGITDTNTALNNPMGSGSLSVAFWIKWTASQNKTTMLEYGGTTGRGIHFWLLNGGIWEDLSFQTSCPASKLECKQKIYSLFTTVNQWYHFGFVYNGSAGLFKVYLNYTLIAVALTGQVNNLNTW